MTGSISADVHLHDSIEVWARLFETQGDDVPTFAVLKMRIETGTLTIYFEKVADIERLENALMELRHEWVRTGRRPVGRRAEP